MSAAVQFDINNEEAVLLVTGAAGFIGSSFVRLILDRHPNVRVLNLDKLTYAGNLENLKSVEDSPRYSFFRGDIAVEDDVQKAFDQANAVFGKPVDAVVHYAAESHVDRSIENPTQFLVTNVLGTEVMLRIARRNGVKRFLHVSTDEVYGSLTAEDPAFEETTPIAPNSPYSASKAGSDLIARAYFETYKFPVLMTRCSNNYGPYQFPEKLIPLVFANAVDDKPIPVYGQGTNIRDWIYVDDHSLGVEAVLMKGTPGEVYNLGGLEERANIEVVKTILDILGKPHSLITYVTDRLGHDLRYAMNVDRAKRELGWAPTKSFEDGIRETVAWYLENSEWVNNVRLGAYRDYYERMYDNRAQWVDQMANASSDQQG